MKAPPPTRLRASLRIGAEMCALLWLVGLAICGMERVYDCAGRKDACAGHCRPADDHRPVAGRPQGQARKAESHHDGAAQAEHDDHRKTDSNGDRCCSTMTVLLPQTKPIVIADSISQQVVFAPPLNAGWEYGLATPNWAPVCHPNSRVWVFSPAVCLGPAHLSLAPPSSPGVES